MDLHTVVTIRSAHTRGDLTFAPGERVLGGGTWLFSEPQPEVTGLVDVTSLGWAPLEIVGDTLVIAATCTIAELARLEPAADWAAHALIADCCESLLGSFKVWNVATVGGNICLALSAAPMSALALALDATALLWAPDGSERRIPVADFVLGAQRTALNPGEVMRSIEVPLAALRSRVAFRRIALSPLGRTGTMVIARATPGGVAVTVAGGTLRPHELRFDSMPDAATLELAVAGLPDWFDDAHGSADWRRAMSVRFAREAINELRGELRGDSA